MMLRSREKVRSSGDEADSNVGIFAMEENGKKVEKERLSPRIVWIEGLG